MADYWPNIITGLSGLIGTLVGAGSTLIGQRIIRRDANKEEVAGLKNALAAEIEAYIHMVRLRDQIPLAQQLIEANRAALNHGHFTSSSSVLPKGWLTSFEKNSEAFPVFRNNVDKIGKLGSVCGGIV